MAQSRPPSRQTRTQTPHLTLPPRLACLPRPPRLRADLRLPTAEWGVGGTPLLSMMHLERRSGKDKPVIAKALVEMGGAPMRAFAAARPLWAIQDSFQSPGPIQVGGWVGGCGVLMSSMRGGKRRGRRQAPVARQLAS